MDLEKEGEQLAGLTVYPRSIVWVNGTTYFLVRSDDGRGKCLGILGDSAGFEGNRDGESGALLCCLTSANATALRARLPWLNPVPLGLQTSAGFGDRLGLATPGHVRAVRHFSITPIFAQQSVRENERAGRTPQQVLDDATWGLFEEGWRDPWGADADHLRTLGDVDAFIAAGYTLYTIDPSEHMDNVAHSALPAEIKAKVQALPWEALENTLQDMEERYLGRSFDLGKGVFILDREALWRASAKYARAIAHTVRMYRYLVDRVGDQAFELEVSVDEMETTTSPAEHFYIASELRRLGVRWLSLAPRFIGRFEKGVDYIGDLEMFSAQFATHAAVAQALGPYKLSIHSGSDKFSLYPIIAKHAGKLVHLKTAGTSYLEALRVVASVSPTLFRKIMAFALEHYEEERFSYHVSASPSRVPPPERVADSELPQVLDLFDGRQVLHVTFGSVMSAVDSEGRYRFRDQLLTTIANSAEAYYEVLEAHLCRHLRSLV